MNKNYFKFGAFTILIIIMILIFDKNKSIFPGNTGLQEKKFHNDNGNAPSIVNSANIQAGSQNGHNTLAVTQNVINQDKHREEVLERYRQVILEVSQLVKEMNIDDKELVQRLIRNKEENKGFENIPDRLIAPIKKMHSIASELQEIDLKADGKTLNDLKKFESYKPKWIQQREEELSKVSVSSKANDFVKIKIQESSISDEDIKELITICLKKRDCVEASIYQLMNANHLLSENQLKIISKNIN